MLRRETLAILVPLLLCSCGTILLTNCGTGDCTGDTPVPRISSVTPNSLNMGALPTTITVSGSKFVSWSVVNLNGSPLNTSYVSGSRLTATVPVDTLTWWNISSGSTVEISVTNAGSTVGAFAGGALGCSNGGTSATIALRFE